MTADRRHDRFPIRSPLPVTPGPLGGPLPVAAQAPAQPALDRRWGTTSPEGLAERAVGLAGGCRYVRLVVPGADPVYLGPYPNPAAARDQLDAVRAFAAALLRAGGRR